MSPETLQSQFPTPARRDYYNEFIEGSRWLRREQIAARSAWYDEINLPDKEARLFELEMLLKGLVCLRNSVNHTGPVEPRRPLITRNFHAELQIVRGTQRRIIQLLNLFTAGAKRTIIFKRYLASVISTDNTHVALTSGAAHLDRPKESLIALLSFFENQVDLVEGLLRADFISYKLFCAVLQMAQSEIERSSYFNPLAVLEFRVEFDQIHSPPLLALVRNIQSDPAFKVAALSFLAFLRSLRYIDFIEACCRRESPRILIPTWLAVLRSDIRALTVFFKRDAPVWLANGFAGRFEYLRAEDIHTQYPLLVTEFRGLKSLRELVVSVADQVRVEQRKLYEQALPSFANAGDLDNFAAVTHAGIAPLRAFLQNAVFLFIREFDPTFADHSLFADPASTSAQSDRLRRDIWMFRQVLRGFIQKAKASASLADKWASKDTFRFVKEFAIYFRSMGYHLLRYSDYDRFNLFLQKVDKLGEGDVLEVQRLGGLVESFEDFRSFLKQTFDAVGKRAELNDLPFDREEAIRTLTLFLKR